MAGRRGWVVVAVVVVAVIVGIIVAVRATDSDPGSGPRVVVVGDSVTHQSAAELADAFTWTSNLEVQGRSGFRTDELLPVARRVMAEQPDVAVFLPGYNDVWQAADTDAAVVEMMALAGEAPCAVWMLLPTKGEWPPERMAAFNARVEELAAGHGVHVDGTWRDLADATEGPDPDPELVAPDRVHPTGPGSRAIAAAVEAAVSRHCR